MIYDWTTIHFGIAEAIPASPVKFMIIILRCDTEKYLFTTLKKNFIFVTF